MTFNCRDMAPILRTLVQVINLSDKIKFWAFLCLKFSPFSLLKIWTFLINTIVMFLGHFCGYLVTDVDYFIITMMKANFNSMYFMQDFIRWLGHFVGGGVEVVGLLTFGGGAGVWCKIESLQTVDLQRMASLLTMIDNCDNFNFDLYMTKLGGLKLMNSLLSLVWRRMISHR